MLWVVQIGLETAFVQLEIRPLLTMETKVLTLEIDGIAAVRAI